MSKGTDWREPDYLGTRLLIAALLALAFASLLVSCGGIPERPDPSIPICETGSTAETDCACYVLVGLPLEWRVRDCPPEEPDATPTPEPPAPTPTPGPPGPTPTPPPPEPAPEPTPTPAPEPVGCEPVSWPPDRCGEHIDEPILHEAAVREAIRSVLLRDSRFREGQSLPEHLWVDYAAAVTEELTAAGLCASKTSAPVPSKEEVAVWTGPEQREHWDIVVGTADRIGVDQLFLAWVCRRDGDDEPGPDLGSGGPVDGPEGRTCRVGGHVGLTFPSVLAACRFRLEHDARPGGHITEHTIRGERWYYDEGRGWYRWRTCERYETPYGRLLNAPTEDAAPFFGVECSP